jgi:hypothetical protein
MVAGDPLKLKIGEKTWGKFVINRVPGGHVILYPLVFSVKVTGLTFFKLSISADIGTLEDEETIPPIKGCVEGTLADQVYIC